MFSKTVLRKELQAKRLGLLDSKNHSQLNAKLSRLVAEYLRAESGGEQASTVWASYQPRNFEANPNLELSETAHRWVYPRVDGESLAFYEPQSEADWETGFGGIKEPRISKLNAIQTNELAGMLVPGVAFDTEGGRMGSGKGFYDRVLAKFSGLKIGVSWEAMVEKRPLPTEAHDIPMDVLITEDCVRDLRKGIRK